jgi:hypothetical protein
MLGVIRDQGVDFFEMANGAFHQPLREAPCLLRSFTESPEGLLNVGDGLLAELPLIKHLDG